VGVYRDVKYCNTVGRTEPGVCFRLFTELDMFDVMEERTPPEMQRANLATVVMQVLSHFSEIKHSRNL